MSVHFARFLKAPWFFVGFFVLLGGGLRFWGIFHGLQEGFIYHPDAAHYTVGDAWNLYVTDRWVGETFKQLSPLYIFLHAFFLRIVEWLSAFWAIPVPWSFPLVAGLGSVMTATLGTLTILVVYGLGVKAYGHLAGVVAAGLFSVSPLHSFQSHYPYPDVAMTFFLSLTLLVSIISSQRFSLPYSCLSVLLAAAAVGTKLFGVASGPAVLLSQVLAWRRRGSWLWGVLALGLALLLILVAYTFLLGQRGVADVRSAAAYFTSSFPHYLRIGAPYVLEDLRTVGGLLWHWSGLPALFLAVVGVAVALWRRTVGDLILVLSTLSIVVLLALWPFLDDRFIVPLTPILAVFSGRVIAEGLHATGRRAVKAGVIVLVLGLVFIPHLHRSARQGLLLSLPDTRFVAGKWIASHVPSNLRLGIEGYYPLGANEWPEVGYFDARQPFSSQAAEFDLIVTSSVEHSRYLERPARYPAVVNFFRDLSTSARLVKSFQLGPLGFIHSTVRVYWPTPPARPEFYRVHLPRPYGPEWNAGIAWMAPGPYDRDDRTIVLGGGYQHSTTLVSEQPIRELKILLRNGPAVSRVRIRVGWDLKRRTLAPHGQTVVTFHPKTPFWGSPFIYPLRVSVQSAEWIVAQIRQGARELGEAYWDWGEWERAIAPLQAALSSAGEPELLTLLTLAYSQNGRGRDAKSILDHLARGHADYLKGILTLGSSFPDALSETLAFDQAFAAFTGLNPRLLRHSLSKTFEAEELERHRGTRILAEGASRDRVVAFDRRREPAGIVVAGPYQHFPWGAYEAIFRLRAWNLLPYRAAAQFEVHAGTRLLASRVLMPKEIENLSDFFDFSVRFSHTNPRDPLEFVLVAPGGADLWFDRVQVRPDLAGLFRLKADLLRGAGLGP